MNFLLRSKSCRVKDDNAQPISKEEYERVVTNVFNVHGLPQVVFKSVAAAIVKNLDQLLTKQTRFNGVMRDFIEKECKNQMNNHDSNETKPEVIKRFERIEQTASILESELKKKAGKAGLDRKADVALIQNLEEKYYHVANGMVSNQFRAFLVFKVN